MAEIDPLQVNPKMVRQTISNVPLSEEILIDRYRLVNRLLPNQDTTLGHVDK
mgnify:CR=1 FL=1